MNNYSFQMHFHFPLKIYHLVLLPQAVLTGQVIISYKLLLAITTMAELSGGAQYAGNVPGHSKI